MRRFIPISNTSFLFVSLLVLILSSCVSQKKIKYFQTQQENDTTSAFSMRPAPDYKIQPNDNLYIRIYSMDEKTNDLFNRISSTGGTFVTAQNYFESYTVSSEGYIEFPVIGKIFIKNLTIEQSRTLIQQLVDEYLKETVVVVKMSIFNITILGEVRSPGEIQVYQDKINIFEAISKAGDLTDFANRNKIILVRQVKNSSRIHYIDLTSDKVLSSEYYYLVPNDILYASPLKVKQYGFTTFPYALIFSSITVILAFLTFLKVY